MHQAPRVRAITISVKREPESDTVIALTGVSSYDGPNLSIIWVEIELIAAIDP